MSMLPNDSPFRTDKKEPFEFPPHCSTFQPDIWKVMKDDIYFSIECIDRALEYAKQCLRFSETAHKDNPIMYKCFETTIKHDINLMEKTLNSLRKYGSKDEYFPSSELLLPQTEAS